MAKQHFYSRVPARASMYNRTDGFDTFAHSEGLERSFVEKEMAPVYENKLTKNDMDAVRLGQMPVVYSQSVLKTGQVVQSCVSYLPKDYTGERCAYLCHSLLLSDEELEALHSGENSLLNPAMFTADISFMDLQSQTADGAYPEKDYVPAAGEDPAELTQNMDSNGLKAFLYGLLSILCAKGKSIYCKLPGELEALRFLRMVATVVPYHLRRELSFVTYVTDLNQYNHVKIKFMAPNCPEPAKGKGIFVDLATGLVTGMPAADLVAKAPVEFFYSLLSDSSLRRDFLTFADTVVKAMPSLKKLNLKALSDLVFLFSGASGLFETQKVLPTDEHVYNLFATYEKYREALRETYRCNVYQCLQRYPDKHLAIPKNIFSKLSKLYPTDAPAAKQIAVHAVLELIHTDIMRDKLFVFLRNNYENEAPDVQNMIDMDLCSVFYGGFLQEQILAFFSDHFAQMPEQVRQTIFDKLMLSIRTVSVQAKILQFVKDNYGIFSEKEKEQFYATAFEMLPECDSLAAELVPLLNSCLAREGQPLRQQTAMQLAALLEADYRKKEHLLLPILCSDYGFCYETVLLLVLGPWNNRKAYEEYLQLLRQREMLTKTRELAYIAQVLSGREEALVAKLLLELEQLYATDLDKTDLYQWLEADRVVKEQLEQYNQSIAWLIGSNVIQKAIVQQVADAFLLERKDGVQIIAQYAKDNPFLTKAPQYQPVQQFLQLIQAAQGQQQEAVFRALDWLCKQTALSGAMANTLRRTYLDWETQNPEEAALYEISSNALAGSGLLSQQLYSGCKAYYVGIVRENQPKLPAVKAERLAADQAGALILRYLVTACNESPALCRLACEDVDGLREFAQYFCTDHGIGGEKWMLARLNDAPVCLTEAVRTAAAGAKPQSSSFLARLFKK